MKKAPRWRALTAQLGRALEVLEPDEALEAVGVLVELAARARAVRLEGEVLEFIAAHPGATSNRVAEHVHSDRALVLRRLRDLEGESVLRWEPGPKGARLWYATKTSRACQPEPRSA